MNCAIYKKGSDVITHFVRDCKRVGRDFIGSNKKVVGIKEAVWDYKFTLDDTEEWSIDGGKAKYHKKVSELKPAPVFMGEPVGTEEDVDEVIRKAIRERYSAEEEYKIIRKRLAGLSGDFDGYNEWVENLVDSAKQFKTDSLKKDKGDI